MDGAIRLAVINDDRMLLTGLSTWLARTPDVMLCATAPTVSRYLEDAPDVDVVLLDLNVNDGSQPSGNVTRLRSAGYRVLVTSTVPDAQAVLASVAAGAAGYVTMDHDLNALVTAVRAVAVDGSVVTPELAFIICTDSRPGRPQLSDQERVVLDVYATGSTLPAAARRAGVDDATARALLMRVWRRYAGLGRDVER